MAEHDLRGEVVVGRGLFAVALHELHRRLDRGDVRARARRHDPDETEVVDVLMGEDHEADVLDAMTVRPELPFELVQRASGVRPGVHEGERIVLDQVHVHPPDGEWRGDREPVDARRGRGREGVGYHPRTLPPAGERSV